MRNCPREATAVIWVIGIVVITVLVTRLVIGLLQ